MYTDAILNLAWAALCLTAFAWFVGFERSRGGSWRTVASRAVALSLALVSLFPCVSASDDSVRLQFLGASSADTAAPQHTGGSHKAPASGDQQDKKALATLVRMLEALDSAQISVSLALYIVLCLFAFARIETHQSLDRFLPARAGRAPPLSNPRLIPV